MLEGNDGVVQKALEKSEVDGVHTRHHSAPTLVSKTISFSPFYCGI